MATARVSRLFSTAEPPLCVRCLQRSAAAALGLRWSSSSTAPSSTLHSRIREQLKAAMRAKDTARLTVLRGTISEINQAASGSNPIRTDMQILALLRKRRAASEAAEKEAHEAGRPDLVEKLEKEVTVIEELVGSVKVMDPQDLRNIVRATIETLRGTVSGDLKQGVVLKELLKPDGELADKPLDKKVLADVVKEELASNHNPS
ncbi:hypothetical protein A1O3_07361 [Capronia epimyces CBS 606.96]|uniref:Altered inheritance of mitochondria protein 41 n=1 Tax=Capronia epimyces CBS 606.96 TaxID=1182542 RepID=W9XLI2_9EURO|nr:uncharacterized protein A1O3_07361 [Capronia epimyces CBS 606.96]EXJ81073.1 hypothetical protein A1O3_07361 [Capronia epimyces CBS 606.96]